MYFFTDKIEYFFVRRNFIEFLEGILPILTNLFYQNNFSQLINFAMTFITTFSKLLIENIHYSKRVKRDTNRFSHSNPINKNFIIISLINLINSLIITVFSVFVTQFLRIFWIDELLSGSSGKFLEY